MVRPERFELPTYCSGGNRSIQSELRAHCANYTYLRWRDFGERSAARVQRVSLFQSFYSFILQTSIWRYSTDRCLVRLIPASPTAPGATERLLRGFFPPSDRSYRKSSASPLADPPGPGSLHGFS